ncbi:MAG: SOUL family heme-binding protein [Methylotenera sp.]
MKRYLISFIALLFAGAVMAIEEPKYNLIQQSGDVELREYAPKIIAETVVSGDLDDASSKGFKRIADYIFGNNTAPTGSKEKIAMTAPVTMEAQSEKIGMTTPVTMQKTEGMWRMHFVMPSQYTMETLPKPNNPAVTLRQLPSKRYAVIRFSWFAGEEKVVKKTSELLAWMKHNNITPKGSPELARYNPPWTPPFLRRNEVMIAF